MSDSHQQQQGRDGGEKYDKHPNRNNGNWMQKNGHNGNDGFKGGRGGQSSGRNWARHGNGGSRQGHLNAWNPNSIPPRDHQDHQYRNRSPRSFQEDQNIYPRSSNYSRPLSREAQNYRQLQYPRFRGSSPGGEHFRRGNRSGSYQERSWSPARGSQTPPHQSQDHQNWNPPSMECPDYSSQGNYNSNYDNDYHEPPRRRSNSPYDQGGRHGQYGSRESSSRNRQGSRFPSREQRQSRSPNSWDTVSRSPSPRRHRQRSPVWHDDGYPAPTTRDRRDFDYYQSSSNRDPESRSSPRGVQTYQERNQITNRRYPNPQGVRNPYRTSDNSESNSRRRYQEDYDSDYGSDFHYGLQSHSQPSSSHGVQNHQRNRTHSRERDSRPPTTTQNMKSPTPPSREEPNHPPRDCGTPNSWDSTSRSPSPLEYSDEDSEPTERRNFPNPKASWLKWLEEQDNREDSEDDMEETIEEIRKALAEEARPLPTPIFRGRRGAGGVFQTREVVQTRAREKTVEEWKSEMEMQSSETWKANYRPTTSDPTSHSRRHQDPPCTRISKLTREIVNKEYINPRLKNPCVFCSNRHMPDECPFIVDVQARREHLVKNGHCVRCLRKHRAHQKCYNPEELGCHYCDDQNPEDLHHWSLCLEAYVPMEKLEEAKKEKKEDVEEWPSL